MCTIILLAGGGQLRRPYVLPRVDYVLDDGFFTRALAACLHVYERLLLGAHLLILEACRAFGCVRGGHQPEQIPPLLVFEILLGLKVKIGQLVHIRDQIDLVRAQFAR